MSRFAAKSLYDSHADGVVNAAINSQPFQFVEVSLTRPAAGANANDGLYLPQIEGNGFTVIAADYPCSSFLNLTSGRVATGPTLRPGVSVKAPFKGLTIAYPEFARDVRLRLVVWKGDSEWHDNSQATHFGGAIQVKSLSLSALAASCQIWVPTGATKLESLSVFIAASTLTSAILSGVDRDGVNIVSNGGVPFIDPVRPNFSYDLNNNLAQHCDITQPATGVFKCKAEPMILPTATNGLQINSVGTGITAFVAGTAIAVFS